MAGFLFQAGVEFGAVFVDPGHAVGCAEASDEPGGMPRRATGELVLFQQQDIFPAEPGQMISDAAADNAAPDDDDRGLDGEKGIHDSTGV